MKKILFPLFSIFLSYMTVGLLRTLTNTEPNVYSAISILIIAFLLTLYITGIFAFTGFAFPTHRVLPKSYYEIKNDNILINLNNMLGVKYFKYLLLLFFWGRKKNRKNYFNGTKNGLQNFIFQTKQSEFGHFGAFVIITITSIFLLAYGYLFLVIVMTLINIIGNGYPIILQRMHRLRIEKITKRNI